MVSSLQDQVLLRRNSDTPIEYDYVRPQLHRVHYTMLSSILVVLTAPYQLWVSIYRDTDVADGR